MTALAPSSIHRLAGAAATGILGGTARGHEEFWRASELPRAQKGGCVTWEAPSTGILVIENPTAIGLGWPGQGLMMLMPPCHGAPQGMKEQAICLTAVALLCKEHTAMFDGSATKRREVGRNKLPEHQGFRENMGLLQLASPPRNHEKSGRGSSMSGRMESFSRPFKEHSASQTCPPARMSAPVMSSPGCPDTSRRIRG